MSITNVISGLSYGVMGFFIGGPVGGVIGFAVGFGMSLLMDHLEPDMPSAGQPQIAELAFPTAQEGLNIPELLGTSVCSGNLFHCFGSRAVKIKKDTGGSKGGGGGEIVTGYEY